MDASIIVPSLIDKLQNLLNHEPTLINPKLRDIVQDVTNQLKSFQGYLKCAENNEALGDPMDNQWMARLLNTVYSAEDAIETFLMRIALHRQRQAQKESGFRELCRPFCCATSLQSQYDLFANEMNSLMREFKELSSHDNLAQMQGVALDVPESSFLQNEWHTQLQRRWDRISGSCLDQDMDVVGLEKQIDELVVQLTLQDEFQRFDKVIALVGDGGSGKTTLARTVYNRANIKKLYRTCAWVCFSEDSEVGDVLVKILKQAEEEVPRTGFKAKKNSLLVMDGVERPEVLEKIRLVSSKSYCGWTIIITTRKSDVAQHADSFIQLCWLNNTDSWALFLKRVCIQESTLENSGLITLKDQILKTCGGLPLAVILMGGLLSTKELSYQAWSRVVTEYENIKGDVFALSYQDLPFRIKPCFLYMGLFPIELEIPVRRLLGLWLAEGFVSLMESPSIFSLEDLAEIYFKELVCRNLIEVARWRPDGSPKTCRLPKVLHDIFTQKAKDIGLFYVLHKSYHLSAEQPKFAARRLASYSKNFTFSEHQLEHLRTYVSFNTRKVFTSVSNEIDLFFKKVIAKKDFRLLKVLDLEGVCKPALPEALGRLFRFLSYLGLRSTALDSLPPSVGELPDLQTLDVKHTFITSLPSSICKAKNLRHLYMNWIDLDMSNQDSSSWSFTELQTLWGLSISKDSPMVNHLKELTSIRKLGLSYISLHDQAEAMGDLISRLTKLQSLMLISTQESNEPSEIKLGPLAEHHNLSKLYLLGFLPSSNINVKFLPPNLKILTLSLSKLEEDPMPMLGQLPHLTILKLFANSYMGEKMTCHRGRFPCLHVLKLWKLPMLKQLILEDGALPCLRELEIRQCYKLFPRFDEELRFRKALMHLAALRQLTITNMDSRFLRDFGEKMGNAIIKRNQWKSSSDDITIYEGRYKSFIRM